MTIKAIDHVQLAMPAGRESEAVVFYQDLLGLPQVEKPANLQSRGGCWFALDRVRVHVGVEANFTAAKKAHPAFVVDNLPALVARLEAAGHCAHSDEPLEGYARVYVDDPFGNRIELMEPAG